MGRPRIDPDRWRAVVALRSSGFGAVETARLLDLEKRAMERNYKRDVEKFLPDIWQCVCVAHGELKKKVISREFTYYGKTRPKGKDTNFVYQAKPEEFENPKIQNNGIHLIQ